MSKAGKYKIYADDQFLGHFSGHAPMDAVRKAIDRTLPFYRNKINADTVYTVSRGSSKSISITLGE